ncbi:DNA-binding transcriptional regulator, ArsR family [Pseudoxanthobacter soli DSM 19599]|uniref:DNA-binding transcriptional regulator, ArsR family n=1 Tax=Pseudoxanthobacter soli DSM 19599 TaxID=1123029 RepID=A0A1M7ZNQ7_9HYPH|nr:metalloregulator ArsR/SmtB family transcription factor [Pseudoxanthobacter soli]SHO66449.1 DNA-binding transcriptional regulator, ArsR family [Pseudoxanthobacter soli DSM 19599]
MKLNGHTLSGRADEAVALLRALANPHRLLILCRLAEGERPVGELAAEIGCREAVVSQHLALLRHDGLVAGRREGKTIHYRLASPAAAAVLEAVRTRFCLETGDGREPLVSPRKDP